MKKRIASLVALLALTALAGGCSHMLDADREIACGKLPNWYDRDACLKEVRGELRDYDRKRQQIEAGEAGRREAQDARQKGMCFKRAATGETVCPN